MLLKLSSRCFRLVYLGLMMVFVQVFVVLWKQVLVDVGDIQGVSEVNTDMGPGGDDASTEFNGDHKA